MLLIIMAAIFFIILILVILYEKRNYNNGICRYCGKPLRHFDTDSQGGRGYMCDCGYCVWISYPCVDKN